MSLERRDGESHVAFFLQNVDGGGAERAVVALAGQIARRGCIVDLVLGDASSDYRAEIPPEVNVYDFRTTSASRVLGRLVDYLRQRKPTAAMAALDTPNILLVIAAALAGFKGRTIVSQRAAVDASHRELPPLRRMATRFAQRACFRHADGLISNSLAATRDLVTQFGIAPEKIVTIPNAVDVERIGRLAAEPVDATFSPEHIPMIVSVGSLTERKDVPTLIKAFARVRAQRPAKLVIIGKGAEQGRIEALIAELGITDDVHLPGFDANPYKWMAVATVFVSASTGEGFPNVIAEALALGRPVVATDCPGDTAELLGHGQWGRLVPVGDPERMAAAIVAAMDDRHPADGRIRAADFSPVKNTSAYLEFLLPRPGHLAVEAL